VDIFPSTAAARDRFVLDRRGVRPEHDPWRYQNLIVEDERTETGDIARVATIFLTGRECPWRCVMCDLWQSTIPTDTPAGALPAQIGTARRMLFEQQSAVSQIKLYNAGSFFDPHAVPEDDYRPIAAQLAGLARVIVESHPALVGTRVDRFLEALEREAGGTEPPPQLEVAMGLETVHAEALERLHKRMTVAHFMAAADTLRERGVALRVFLLIAPPFIPRDEQEEWLLRSVDVAFSCGASVVSLIPTRSGNGAMEALAAEHQFRQPSLDDIERSVATAHTVSRHRGRLFVDLWDLPRFSVCGHCVDSRRARLQAFNLEQCVPPAVVCAHCRTGTS
jgi:radical SAM enzyme (TIGR01210 family)